MAHLKINWKAERLSLNGKEYRWDDPDEDLGEDRHMFQGYRPKYYWTKVSKKWVVYADGHARKIADLDEEQPENSDPYWVQVKREKLVRKLERILAKAKEKREQKREAEREEEGRVARRKAAKKRKRQTVSPEDETLPSGKAFDFRLKSAVNDYELSVRIAPSKKHAKLQNFSVYRGQRLLGYVEVESSTVERFHQRLSNFLGREFGSSGATRGGRSLL